MKRVTMPAAGVRREPVTAQENEIDRLVYALYGLTEDEIAAVKGSLAAGTADDGTARAAAGGAGPTG